MIHAVQLCVRHRLRVKRPAEIRFGAGVNVLIGPNGSGKSTVLRALRACPDCRIERDDAPLFYFDAETMNPHAPVAPPGNLRGLVLRARGVFSSHGEIMRAALFSLPVREGAVLLVDEPEAGQDLEGVRRIRRGFEAIVAAGGQVIAATHHPLLLAGARVIELLPGYERVLRGAYCAVCRGTKKTSR